MENKQSDSPTIGQRIRRFRKEKGLSQQELEVGADLSFGSVSRFESDEINPTKETLLKIASFLKLSSGQQSALFGISDQPPTKEEFLETYQYVESYLETNKKPSGLSDICGFMWSMNKSMRRLYEIDLSDQKKIENIQRTHLLEWFFNPQSCGYKIVAPSSRDDFLLYQSMLFIFVINYFERKEEQWIKHLLIRLERYPDFSRIWSIALEKAMLKTPLSREQLVMKFIVNGKIKRYYCNSIHINKFPNFLITELLSK